MKIISANCSFPTTFPALVTFPVSDVGSLFSKIKDELMELAVTKTGGETASYSFDNASAVSDKLFGIFENSVRSIVEKLGEPADEYTAAGLQELNNTQRVTTLGTDVLGQSYKLICSNTFDEYNAGGAYASLGYIIPETFLPKLLEKKINNNQLQVYSIGPDSFIDIPEAVKITKNYSIAKTDANKLISIRDLGAIEDVDGVYLLKNNNPLPDSGRPISMIIVDPAENNGNAIIHLNCHMPNPSVLKTFTKTGEIYAIQEPNTTILAQGDTAKTAIWVTYCKNRLKKTIEAMLGDFGITSLGTPYNNATWIITGDFNDATGELMSALESGGVNIFETDIEFKFGRVGDNFPITCCVNTNSSLPNSNGKPASEKALEVKALTPFNKAFAYLTYISKTDELNLTPGEQADKATLNTNFKESGDPSSVLTPANFAFSGDNVGFCKSNGTIGNVSATSINEGTSDHSFVLCDTAIAGASADPSSKGGSRRKRRSSKRNRTRKQKRSKRRRRR
jgi:hypothetical protein